MPTENHKTKSRSGEQEKSASSKHSQRRHPLKPLSPLRGLLGCLALVAAAWLVFGPLLNVTLLWPEADFVERSASHTVANNSEQSRSLTSWIHANPLAIASYQLEQRLPALQPRLHFAINLMIHTLNCLLLWWTLRGLRIKVAFATSLIFCIHPVVLQPLFWSGYRETLLAMTALLLSTGIAARARSGTSYGFSIGISIIAPFLHPLALCQPILLLGVRLKRLSREGIRAFNPVLPYLMIALAVGVFISTIADKDVPKQTVESLGVQPEQAPASYLGQQINHALKRAYFPFDFAVFYPQQIAIEGGAQPVQALHFLPFLLLLPPLILGIIRFRDHWAPSLLFGLVSIAVLLLYFLTVAGHGPGGELVHEDHRLYFALPAMIAILLGTFRLGLEKLGPLGTVLKVTAMSLLLIVYSTVSIAATRTLNDTVAIWESIAETLPTSWAAKFGLIQSRITDDASGLDFEWMQETILGILRERPDFMELRLRLLALYRETGRLEQAERQVRQLLFDTPRDLDLLRLFADINAELGRSWEVVNAHERILAQAPNNEESLRMLVQLHLDNERFQQASVLLQRLSHVAPEDVQVALIRSQVLRILHLFEEAETFHEELAASLQLQPNIRIEKAWVRAGSNPLEAQDMARQLEYELRDEPELLPAVRQLLATLESR
jgi:tetratricopeptide (TPR) repeat protein